MDGLILTDLDATSATGNSEHTLQPCIAIGSEDRHSANTQRWIVLQIADSAFPIGGFAHSGGLEAAWQQNEVRTREELIAFVEASLRQLQHGSLPFVNQAYIHPSDLPEIDECCEAFLINHVANRASRLQGRAFLGTVSRTFGKPSPETPYSHFAPVFGNLTSLLGFGKAEALQLFTFCHLRSLLAAAVKLNIIGPMEAQSVQYCLVPLAERAAASGCHLGLDELAQTAPLLELWQLAQDRLYSRLFQT